MKSINGPLAGVVIGAGIGFFSQWFMSKQNHKRELEKLGYEKKYGAYMELLNVINSASIFIDSETLTHDEINDTVVKCVSASKDKAVISIAVRRIQKLIGNNPLIISDKIKHKTKRIMKKLEDDTYDHKDYESFNKLLQSELGIK
ncbi:MAG: hypothetical protein AB7E76_06810 [Deferribacterales bacterium]